MYKAMKKTGENMSVYIRNALDARLEADGYGEQPPKEAEDVQAEPAQAEPAKKLKLKPKF